MEDIIQSNVTALAPELAGTVLSDQAWVDILAYVNQFNLTTTDSDIDRRLARIYLAAHIGSVNKRAASASSGPIVSESVGGVRRSYGQLSTATSASSLSSTRYGQLYSDLLGASGAGGPMLV